jgi:hypothetical protein
VQHEESSLGHQRRPFFFVVLLLIVFFVVGFFLIVFLIVFLTVVFVVFLFFATVFDFGATAFALVADLLGLAGGFDGVRLVRTGFSGFSGADDRPLASTLA